MRKIRRLYIIGAGASFPYGLPTLDTLTWGLCQFLEASESKIIHETSVRAEHNKSLQVTPLAKSTLHFSMRRACYRQVLTEDIGWTVEDAG
jgi:hypothetical protein